MDKEEKVKKVKTEYLIALQYGNGIKEQKDADDVLSDYTESITFRQTETSADILELWERASKKEREVIEEIFHIFTDTTFERYLDTCLALKTA